LSAPERIAAALREVPTLPRDAGGPVFPAPWAARAFAFAVALQERGVFSWREWSQALGKETSDSVALDAADAEAYWRAWLKALEELLERKALASPLELKTLAEAWRKAAEATPHGQPIEPEFTRQLAAEIATP
jgi:nitrile hydratase accessory protein